MSETVGAPTARSRDIGTPLTEATRPRTQSTLATAPNGRTVVAAPSSRYVAGSIVISARPSEALARAAGSGDGIDFDADGAPPDGAPLTSRSALSEESAARTSEREQIRAEMHSARPSSAASRARKIAAAQLTRRVATPGLIAWRETLRVKPDEWQTADAGMACMHTFWNVKPGHRVAFRVRARSRCGTRWGEWSHPSDSAMLVGPPSDSGSPHMVSRDKVCFL